MFSFEMASLTHGYAQYIVRRLVATMMTYKFRATLNGLADRCGTPNCVAKNAVEIEAQAGRDL